MLIVLAGLPGTGKTSLARELAAQLGAVHLRIDAIETVLHRVGIWSDEHPAAAYEIAAELADNQLRHGLAVIIDAVNPVPQDRRAWRDLASRRGVTLVAAELACADAAEHRRRVEGRAPDVQGQGSRRGARSSSASTSHGTMTMSFISMRRRPMITWARSLSVSAALPCRSDEHSPETRIAAFVLHRASRLFDEGQRGPMMTYSASASP